MLKCFEVENFKNFDYKLKFDFSDAGNYEFNPEVFNKGNQCITKAIVYGPNGSGKSNLELALFDIVTHLTDKEKLILKYEPYSNLNSSTKVVKFRYEFVFNSLPVIYSYEKTDVNTLLREELVIDNTTVIFYDYSLNEGSVSLKGTEQLNLTASHSPISRVKYVAANSILGQKDPINKAFISFIDYVNHMLLFYSLDENQYQGFCNGSENIAAGIIKKGKLKEFEEFLAKTSHQKYTLKEKQTDGKNEIYCVMGKNEVNLFRIASSGTKSLALFYYWYISLQDASFVFIDEFDAFYHYELAENIVVLLKKLKKQQIVSLFSR